MKTQKNVEEPIREEDIAKFAARAGRLAAEAALANNISISFAKDGRIVTLHPDGTEVIGEVLPKKVFVPADKRIIKFR